MENGKMITEKINRKEIIRPLNNKELEERLYELTEIIKELAITLYPRYDETMWDWRKRLDKLQEDFS